MKIKLIDVTTKHDPDSLNLEECGFVVGDVVEVDGSFQNGDICVLAIRDTDYVSIGNSISVNEGEYEVIEE